MTSPIPIPARQQIIQDAIPRLANGESTDTIAAQYGITGRTLRYWLVSDEQAIEARTAFLADKLMSAAEAIDNSDDSFPLARARESFRAWSFFAERRLPSMFGQKQQVEHKHTVDLDAAMLDARKALQARKVSTTYSVESITDAQIVGDSSTEST